MVWGGAEWFARLAYFPTLLWTQALSKALGRTWYTRIDEWTIVGALPLYKVADEVRTLYYF